MAVPTVYVETSVWGCLAPGQPSDRRRIVRQLLRLLDEEHGVGVISTAVRLEISRAPTRARSAIERHLDVVQPRVIAVTTAVEALAQAYIESGIIPARCEMDAIHIASATCFECDFLVSWNHRHITRATKRLQYEAVNHLHGYQKTPLICNPLEAVDDLRFG